MMNMDRTSANKQLKNTPISLDNELKYWDEQFQQLKTTRSTIYQLPVARGQIGWVVKTKRYRCEKNCLLSMTEVWWWRSSWSITKFWGWLCENSVWKKKCRWGKGITICVVFFVMSALQLCSALTLARHAQPQERTHGQGRITNEGLRRLERQTRRHRTLIKQ